MDMTELLELAALAWETRPDLLRLEVNSTGVVIQRDFGAATVLASKKHAEGVSAEAQLREVIRAKLDETAAKHKLRAEECYRGARAAEEHTARCIAALWRLGRINA